MVVDELDDMVVDELIVVVQVVMLLEVDEVLDENEELDIIVIVQVREAQTKVMIQNEQIEVQQYDIIEVMVENEVEVDEVMVEMPHQQTMLDEVEVEEVDT